MSDLRLTVLGTGYLGATHAACMADLGFEVLGLDVDKARSTCCPPATVPFFEPGLDELLARNTSPPAGCGSPPRTRRSRQFGDVHFLCVGTPQKKGEFAADMTLSSTPRSTRCCRMLPVLALFVGKSTVPAGTAELLAERIAAEAPAGAESSSPGTRSSCARAAP